MPMYRSAAAVLAAVKLALQKSGLNQVTLVGHSLGAHIFYELFRQHSLFDCASHRSCHYVIGQRVPPTGPPHRPNQCRWIWHAPRE